jgi:hypothetical protein
MKKLQFLLILLFFAVFLKSTNLPAAKYYNSIDSNKSILAQDSLAQLNIPPRNPFAISGSEFMEKVENMSFSDREEEIFKEISTGNIPNFLRNLVTIESTFNDANGTPHSVKYQVMPDYLAIGSDEDYCRIPMGPITAQKLADLFGAVMPTRKLVDDIYVNAEIKLEPVTYAPVGNQNELVAKFVQHNSDIEQQRINANGVLGQLVGGIKKDVVLSNKITDPNRPNHVVIYGWHWLTGDPIQPLTNIHFDYYVDYSHGIRLLNAQILIDGEVKIITEILKTQILYKILSDEFGIMTQPTYLTVEDLVPEAPKSFGVISEDENSLKIIIKKKDDVENFLIYLSLDGLTFEQFLTSDSNIIKLSGLEANTQYFIKVAAENSFGTSRESEVLSAVTADSSEPKILIVNGFDRTSDGNTFNFIRQHAESIWFNLYFYESATNDAILDGLIDLQNYTFVDYILGDESTADETFSTLEQNLIISYLRNGGKLFVSGSEIAWDLDYKGSSTDKNFIWNYLKMRYVADAPNNSSQTYYQASVVPNTIFNGISPFFFDNGSNGTINVKWPDVIKGISGGQSFLQYVGFDTSYGAAGVFYEGTFPGGNNDGKIVAMGFPFETIYPAEVRNTVMGKLLDFFYDVTDIEQTVSENLPSDFLLFQNYPNPFNPTTTIKYSIPSNNAISNPLPGERSLNSEIPNHTSKSSVTVRDDNMNVNLTIFDVLGREVETLVNQPQNPGIYQVTFNASALSNGVYYYRLSSGEFNKTMKMMVMK